MKTAFVTGTIIENGPKRGTLHKHLVADSVPNLERKTPPTIDVINDYSNNLIKLSDCKVRLVSTRVVADSIKRMRVRQGKAGPNGKKRTDLSILARGEAEYSFGKVDSIKRNEGFNKFGNTQVPVIHKHDVISWQYEPEIKYKVVAEPTESGNAELKCLNNDKLSGEYYIADPEIRIDSKTSPDVKWTHIQKMQHVKQLSKVVSIGFATNSILDTVNGLLRQALLFKGVDFAKIERDVRTTGKPVTYLLNTLVELDTGKKYSDGRSIVRRVKLHKCTVRKTFRTKENIMGEEQYRCSMLFDGKCCKPITIWLQSLNLYF